MENIIVVELSTDMIVIINNSPEEMSLIYYLKNEYVGFSKIDSNGKYLIDKEI